MAKSNLELLTGLTDSHTVGFLKNQRVHREVEKPLKAMTDEAAKEGYQLQVCSGYRSFQRQCEIWNEKVTGKRPILDSHNLPISQKGLTEEEIIYAILRWSALPATSRHHWGTDLDIIDASKLGPNTTVQLIAEEFEVGGPFSDLHDWLDKNMSRFGFFRPYATDRGGVSPERWHLSYAPLAETYLAELTEELVVGVLKKSNLELKKSVLAVLPQIFQRFILNIDIPTSA
jgi:LAS superfamily LD-carboxypeptidase LdcB